MEEGPYTMLLQEWSDAIESLTKARNEIERLESVKPEFRTEAYLAWQDEIHRAFIIAQSAQQLCNEKWSAYRESKVWAMKPDK